MEELICGILRYFQTEGGCVPVSFSCDEQHESRRVREKKPKFKKILKFGVSRANDIQPFKNSKIHFKTV